MDLHEIPGVPEPPGNNAAMAFRQRAVWVCRDKIKFSIPFVWDMSSSPYIAPGNELKFIFEKNRFNIPLLARDRNLQLNIKFKDAKLRMRRFTLNEPAPLVLEHYFSKKQYYPINRVQMSMRTLPHGSKNIIIPQIVNGQIPWHLFCVLLKKNQQTDLNKDPFSYEPHDLRDFTLLKNGFSVPSQPLIVDDASNDSEGRITAYKHFGVRERHYVCILYYDLVKIIVRSTWGMHISIIIWDPALRNISQTNLSWRIICAETGVRVVMTMSASRGHLISD